MTAKLVRTTPINLPPPSTSRAISIIQRIFRHYEGGISVRLWDGHTVSLGTQPARFVLAFSNPATFRQFMLLRDPLRLAEAHLEGQVDIEGNIYDAIRLKDYFQDLRLSAFEKAAILARALTIRGTDPKTAKPPLAAGQRNWRARPTGRHSQQEDKKAIAFHYDLSNEFYALWLDEQMIYSCAYFETPKDDLELAQRQKLDHICRKLRLKPGETLLDIGCGWGGLLRWAVRHYGVRGHGITLSRKQFDYARQKVKEEGLEEHILIELRDYRDMPTSDQFDKVVSVGMFEHVGIRNLPLYFRTAWRLLKPGGLFLNHGITADRERKRPDVASKFVDRYVFPDGELETIANVQRGMESSGFEILDVESLRPHYSLTLRHWVKRLEKQHQEALKQVDPVTYRIWRLYMAASALRFEAGEMGIYQILAARRSKGFCTAVPLTRRDLYPPLPPTAG